MTKCIAPNCELEPALDSALCRIHKEELEKTEADILKDAGRTIRADLRQFERLLYIEPPLSAAEISHRAVMPMKEVRRLLTKFKDDRA